MIINLIRLHLLFNYNHILSISFFIVKNNLHVMMFVSFKQRYTYRTIK